MKTSRRICFVASDQHFFFRHFRPAIHAALAQSYEILAVLPEDDCSAPIDPLQRHLIVIRSPITRRRLTILALAKQVIWLAQQFRTERPDVVMAFSVRAGCVLALALMFPRVRVGKAIVYITGLGLLELLQDRKSQLLRTFVYGVLRATSRRKNCYFIFENQSDPISMGFRPGRPPRQELLVGAGVDEKEFAPKTIPPIPPLKLATVSRLVWSKGIDLAVQAVAELVDEGYAVELNIYGAPDPANPRSIDPHEWDSIPGINFKGHTKDIPNVWAWNHAAVFASRGGEGVPRSLLEAAACGRACIVTKVSGCAEFVRDGLDGYVVDAGSIAALKGAILKLLNRPELLHLLGRSARQRVLETSTSHIVQEQYEALFETYSTNRNMWRRQGN
jgi:glycosyltransferase involved in cell wall biosynthesis